MYAMLMMHIERLMSFYSNIYMTRFILWKMVANYAVNMTFYFNGGWKQVDERLRCPEVEAGVTGNSNLLIFVFPVEYRLDSETQRH